MIHVIFAKSYLHHVIYIIIYNDLYENAFCIIRNMDL